jgi:hypothetical protein
MMKSMTIKKSTLLASLKQTLFQMEVARDVHPPEELDEMSPYEVADINWQALTFDEQEREIRQAIEECEQLDDSEFVLIDANELRDILQ